VKFAVIGTDHLHVIELVSGLHDAGAELLAIMPTEERIGAWLANQYQQARTVSTIEAALDDVDVVVTAAIPSERAALGIQAMRAGVNVLADKPGATSVEQLDALRAAVAETGQQYLVLFSERLTNRAMMSAYDIARSGRLGRIVHTVGLGPHTLNLEHRPEWFHDPARYGGILVDIGAHQVDQFLAFTGATSASVTASNVRGLPDDPGVEILGEMMLAANDASGYTRVDYLTPKGLAPAWGDVRFTAVGTVGYLVVRQIEQSVLVVDDEGRELLDCSGAPAGWGERYLSGNLVDQEHVFAVTACCLEAQRQARHLHAGPSS
jgi:predicted dehydrogenase